MSGYGRGCADESDCYPSSLNDEYIAEWLEGHRRPTTRPPATWRTLWANRIESAGVFFATLSWDVADLVRGRR